MGPGGTATDSVSVLMPKPTADIKANGSDGPITISPGSFVTVSWTSQNTNPNGCTYTWSGGGIILNEPTSGSNAGNLSANLVFNISCTGPGGTATDSVIVQVIP